jgi:hypothetical protein
LGKLNGSIHGGLGLNWVGVEPFETGHSIAQLSSQPLIDKLDATY